ncbi:ABC transporter permease [Mesorhizobium sp. VNQ89]|uniref:ABC transporter permease n=1 Tax=Mesorhizobium quangtriensis TaxID=3157709 RepID=UPI0032B87288
MESRSNYWLVAPSALIFVVLFIAPMTFFVVLSFWQVEYFELSTEPTLANYRDVFVNYWRVMGFTVAVATATALLTTFLGFVFSFLARFRAGQWAQALLFIVLITLFGGYLMKIYAWKTILGNEGVLNSALMAMGVISSPITSLLYSPQAVIITLMHFSLPFAVLPIYASMRGISDAEVEAARDLGAGRWPILSTVIVPRCQSGIVAGFSFVFLMVGGDYVTPLLVGGKITMIGNLIAPQFGAQFNWPLGAAMSLVMLLAAVVIIYLFRFLVAIGSRP